MIAFISTGKYKYRAWEKDTNSSSLCSFVLILSVLLLLLPVLYKENMLLHHFQLSCWRYQSLAEITALAVAQGITKSFSWHLKYGIQAAWGLQKFSLELTFQPWSVWSQVWKLSKKGKKKWTIWSICQINPEFSAHLISINECQDRLICTMKSWFDPGS